MGVSAGGMHALKTILPALPRDFPLPVAIVQHLDAQSDDFLVEHPTGSGHKLTLRQIAADLSARLTQLFVPPLQSTDKVLFHEYFHGDTGQGLGASHQTGWTALIASLLAER